MKLGSGLEGVYGCFAVGDVPAVLGAMADDIQSPEADGSPLAGTYVGPPAVLEGVFMRLGEIGDHYSVVLERYIVDGDTVVTLGTYTWKLEGAGRARLGEDGPRVGPFAVAAVGHPHATRRHVHARQRLSRGRPLHAPTTPGRRGSPADLRSGLQVGSHLHLRHLPPYLVFLPELLVPLACEFPAACLGVGLDLHRVHLLSVVRCGFRFCLSRSR